jgi:hypothetical protein
MIGFSLRGKFFGKYKPGYGNTRIPKNAIKKLFPDSLP